MRRSSIVPPPELADALRQGSPHHKDGGGGSMDRRKSLFPVVGHRPSMAMAAAASMMSKKGGKMGAPKSQEKGREVGSAYNPPNLEPTYRMEPNAKFFAPEVRKILKEVLDDRLDTFNYNPKFCQTMTRVLTDEIKDRVKQLNFDRYKIVATVILGERRDQGVMITSRCAWDVKLDNFSTYTFKNKTLFCTASVYGIYRE